MSLSKQKTDKNKSQIKSDEIQIGSMDYLNYKIAKYH